MNKKIFTLLAGAFLMFATVFSASAQSAITLEPLRLGDPVKSLKAGPNDFNHLVVTGISDGSGTASFYDATPSGGNTNNNWVLYMGNKQPDNSYPIFIAPLGQAGPSTLWTTTYPWFPGGPTTDPLKTRESASSLWCTVLNIYDQGRYITFDFTNKYEKDQLLEVDVNENLKWTDWINSTTGLSCRTSPVSGYIPGTISGWNFSKAYATTIDDNMPLYSYISEDSVAVLCVNIDDIIANSGSYVDGACVLIKIASYEDVIKNNISGMIYFTLYEAAPFTLDANDFNTMFGTKAAGNQKLTFSPDIAGSHAELINYFTGAGLGATYTGLFAEHIDISSPALPVANVNLNYLANAVAFDTNGSPIDDVPGSYTAAPATSTDFDALGYMYLRTSATTANYLYVQHAYYTGNAGGEKFLKFGLRNLTSSDADMDAALFGQSIWRLVYYPSGDSIYINPYQATYLPNWSTRLMTRGVGSTPASSVGTTLDWLDPLTQSDDFYTFRAKPSNLEASGTPYELMTSRLKYGRDVTYPGPAEFSFYHNNYVTIQNLTGSVKLVTLGNGAGRGNHQIDTWINFNGVYNECSETFKTDRTSVDADLYLIRNEAGQYLRVPWWSATDSAIWWTLEPNEHPELMPSFQWIVEKRYKNSASSQITLINREFDGTKFGYIQLYKNTMPYFEVYGTVDGNWNNPAVYNTAVNADCVEFGKHELAANKKATFIQLGAAYKKDKYLGYTFIPRDEALVNVYGFNQNNGIDKNTYINFLGDLNEYPKTTNDTSIYVLGNRYNMMTFKLDTLNTAGYRLETYGYEPKAKTDQNYIADLVELERQPYYLNFEDPLKFLCTKLFSVMNGVQAEYVLSNVGNYRSYLGIPVFNLRHTFHITNDEGKLEPYFALVQRVNQPLFTDAPAKFEDFLREQQYGPTATNEIMTILASAPTHPSGNDHFKTGVFVAKVDDQTGKLKSEIRADNNVISATFRLVLSDDPLYRRFNTLKEDDVADDAPGKVLKFFSMDYPSYELFENTGLWPSQQRYWDYSGAAGYKPIGKKNYLGYVNINQYADASTAIYVDTAYINRGTGPVKPQYLLVVDPSWPDPALVCDPDDPDATWEDITKFYLRGRFLINATDSARSVGAGANWNTYAVYVDDDGNLLPEYDGRNYLWDTNWERLVFTDAIHAYEKDALYLVEGIDLSPFTLAANTDVIDLDKLDAASIPVTYTSSTGLYSGNAYDPKKPDQFIRKIALGDNTHKDVVFSMRLLFRGADDFMIESETGDDHDVNNRIWGVSYGQTNSNGPVIAPCDGGWVKIQNQVPVISRSNEVFRTPQGLGFNVRRTEDAPVAIDNVAAVAPVIIGGDGVVTILNAAGKQVAISNILGQTVANTVLTSDNATIAAPKGVVVVAIAGQAAVKTLVK